MHAKIITINTNIIKQEIENISKIIKNRFQGKSLESYCDQVDKRVILLDYFQQLSEDCFG